MRNAYKKLIINQRRNNKIINELKVDNIEDKSEKCPYCECTEFIKFGSYKGIQRYRCKNTKCEKTFTKESNNPFRCSKKFKENWVKYYDVFINGLTLRECAKALNITLVTSFYWRHRFLHDLKIKNHIERIDSYVEFTKLVTTENFKGSRNINTKERDKIVTINGVNDSINIISVIAGRRYFGFNEIKKKLIQRIDEKAYIVGMIDARLDYFCKVFIEVNKSKLNEKIEKNTHRKYSIKAKLWLKKFRGIASKYLSDYLSLRAFEYKNNDGYKNCIPIEERIKFKINLGVEISTYITWNSIKLKELEV